jgi:hypothetical protein
MMSPMPRPRTRRRLRLGSALLGSMLACVGCSREPNPDADAGSSSAVTLDLGALRASAVDGLELAASDPAIARALGLSAQLEAPTSQAAIERLLARLTADPELTRASDQLFIRLQDSPAMRAALVAYAQATNESDLAALSEGFSSHVVAQLTRPELAALLERELREQLRASDPALARAFVVEAGGASAIAAGIVSLIQDPSFEPKLRERLGRDPAAVQARLERRLADPTRAGKILIAIHPHLGSESGLTALAQILDHERTAELAAAAMARALADPQLRERCEQLFALALAPEFDAAAFTRALDDLLTESAVTREAAALLSALAREPAVRAHVERLCTEFTRQLAFADQLLAALS